MLTVATALAVAFPAPTGATGGPAILDAGIAIPAPEDDQDLDSYADEVDVADGDLLLRFDLLRVNARGTEPFILIGTQDDHGRNGAGAELEWRHVVDPDPLGRKAGSPTWQRDALRTGTWVATEPAQGEIRAAAETGTLGPPITSGTVWPQTLFLNVRDDRELFRVHLELWDAASRPFARIGEWDLTVDLAKGIVVGDGATVDLGNETLSLGPDAQVALRVGRAIDLNAATKQAIADRWAPTLRFDSDERFFPVPGEALSQFHGFYQNPPDLRTWTRGFNDGRGAYRLLLADFDGDGEVSHEDAAVLTDILRAGNVTPPTVYAHVLRASSDSVIVQYWFLYAYNYVIDEAGRDIVALSHDGDREFVQLRFKDLAAAQNGVPEMVVYGQHYGGFAVERSADADAELAAAGLQVYVARGSHANYPVPGDDRRSRPAFTQSIDRFDGLGETWAPGSYDLQVLGNQPWHMGHLWGPQTRYGRDLGTSTRPLLQHDFRYPYSDPVFWAAALPSYTMDEIDRLYDVGGAA